MKYNAKLSQPAKAGLLHVPHLSAWGGRRMPGAFNATAELLDRNLAAGRADKLAFADPTRQVSYGELAFETRRVANLFARLGVRREERVALLMLDTVDLPAVFLGAMRAGVVPVPLNTLLTADQYAYILADSRARAVVVSAPLVPVLEQALAKLAAPPAVLVAGGDAGVHTPLHDALSGEHDGFDTVATHPDETAFWLYSSGSTGMPKGTRHVHTSLLATAETYGRQVLGIREGDLCYSAAKLFFAYGLGNALTFPMSVGATSFLWPERPTPAAVFKILAERQPSIFYGVPTLYAAMLGHPASAAEPGSPRLRLCVSAGEALPEPIGTAWTKRFGVEILDGVGSTEMLHIYVSNAPGDVRYGTSGRPVPGYEVRLADEAGADVGDGEVGEMLVRGPSAADGYWNQRDKSRRTFEGGWTRTGDKYLRDTDGRYVYCGRADDMFKVSGVWVSPFEVESALVTHPAVLEAAVIPHADADGLLKPKAYVVLKNGGPAGDLHASLRDHVKASVGPWKYPRWVEVLDALPKTATGKIQRFKLREMDAAGEAPRGGAP
jgi:4-hydroxybenzoate-CoA ligase